MGNLSPTGAVFFFERPINHERLVMSEDKSFKAGDNVIHPKFGRGVVLQTEFIGQQERVQVKFDAGIKWLVIRYANLTMLDKQKPVRQRPNLTIVNNNHVNAGGTNINTSKASVNINSSNDVSISTHAPKVTVKNHRPAVKPLPREDAITPGHKADLKVLVDELAELLKIKQPNKNHYPFVRQRLNEQAKSAGKNGVTSIHEFPDCDFERAESYLKQWLGALKKDPTIRDQSPSWRPNTIGAIHARCKELGIDDDTRKAYQKNRFGKESLSDFDNDELGKMYAYVSRDNATFDVKHIKNPTKAVTVQHDREKVLAMLLGELNARNNGELNLEALPFSKEDMRRFLVDKNSLFDGLSDSQFGKFWTAQKLCKVRRGSKMKS
ncbi:MAG: hypothetical protein PHU14_07750 [Methylovulum sp.]|nr:hypothetical protein [Methylovulum sp.]